MLVRLLKGIGKKLLKKLTGPHQSDPVSWGDSFLLSPKADLASTIEVTCLCRQAGDLLTISSLNTAFATTCPESRDLRKKYFKRN